MNENLTKAQRVEYGFYQSLDHLLTRKVSFTLTGYARRKLYSRIKKRLESKGEGRVLEIDRVSDISNEQFLKQYVEKGRPVIIEQGAKNWPCIGKWNLEYFKNLHGKDEILVVDSKHIEQDYEKMTLADLIDNIRDGGSKYYRFYPLLSEHPEHLADIDYNWLRSVRQDKVYFESFQAFIGGKDTESPLHNAMACNLFIQIYGEKRWSLISPHYTAIVDPDPVRNIYRGAPFRKDNYPFNPFKPDYSKPYDLYKYVDRYDFVLKPGDILWNPPFWWHSVVNLSDSIGVGYRWVPQVYCLKQQPLYTILDHLAMRPPMYKGYRLSKKDTNLVHLAEDGRMQDFLAQKDV